MIIYKIKTKNGYIKYCLKKVCYQSNFNLKNKIKINLKKKTEK